MRCIINPRARRGAYTTAEAFAVSLHTAREVMAEVRSWPGYQPTPLRPLPDVAEALGLAEVIYKDEGRRFGLGSFKSLGGAYAATRLLCEMGGDPAGQTLCCATDGNHGRAVAYAAHRSGCRRVVYMHAHAPEQKAQAIVALGAEVVRVQGDYDESVRAVARGPIDAGLLQDGKHPRMAKLYREMARRRIVLDATNRTAFEHDRHPGSKGQCSGELSARLTAQAFRAGVLVSAGTDGFLPASASYPPLFEELSYLQHKVGMSPLEVIRSATLVGAIASGQEKDMGTIAPGKLANLVFVGRDPTADVDNLRSVVMTVKRGRIFPRSDFGKDLPNPVPGVGE